MSHVLLVGARKTRQPVGWRHWTIWHAYLERWRSCCYFLSNQIDWNMRLHSWTVFQIPNTAAFRFSRYCRSTLCSFSMWQCVTLGERQRSMWLTLMFNWTMLMMSLLKVLSKLFYCLHGFLGLAAFFEILWWQAWAYVNSGTTSSFGYLSPFTQVFLHHSSICSAYVCLTFATIDPLHTCVIRNQILRELYFYLLFIAQNEL